MTKVGQAGYPLGPPANRTTALTCGGKVIMSPFGKVEMSS